MKRYPDCWFIWFSPVLLILSFYFSYIALIAFIPLFIAFDKCPFRASVASFFPFAMFIFFGVFQSLHVYYGLNFYFSVFALLFLAVYYSIYAVIPFLLVKYAGLGVLCAAFALVAFEYLRNIVFGGLPIGNINDLVFNLGFLAKGASLLGPYFVSLLVLLINAGLYMAVFKRKFALIVVTAAVVVGGYAIAGYVLASSGRVVSVSLVQGNIPQNIKWNPKYMDSNLHRYMELSEKAKSEIVIWPESAFPYLFNVGYRELVGFAKREGIVLITGVIRSVDNRFYNSVVAIMGNKFEFYDKQRLVPFGEYIPEKWFFSYFLPQAMLESGMSPGRGNVIFDIDGVRFGPMICYEENIPYISRRYKSEGANVLLVLSNDAWFNHTPLFNLLARDAVFRAVENNVWLLRVANTGITEVVSPEGSVTARLRPYREGVLTVKLRLSVRSDTPFDLFGHYFGVVLTIFVFVWIAIGVIFYRART